MLVHFITDDCPGMTFVLQYNRHLLCHFYKGRPLAREEVGGTWVTDDAEVVSKPFQESF